MRIGGAVGTFTRGMLSELTVTLEGWYTLAGVALERWPVDRDTVTGVPGLTFLVEPPGTSGSGWRLTARLRLPRRTVPLVVNRVVPTTVAPLPVLVEDRAEWRVEELSPDRAALAAGVTSVSAALVADLREAAGDRWPSPPRKRR